MESISAEEQFLADMLPPEGLVMLALKEFLGERGVTSTWKWEPGGRLLVCGAGDAYRLSFFEGDLMVISCSTDLVDAVSTVNLFKKRRMCIDFGGRFFDISDPDFFTRVLDFVNE